MRNKIRILIVENEQDYRELEVDLVTAWGYEPVVATGKGDALLQDAVEKARTNRCQVALVDMRLRNNYDDTDISGLNIIQALHPCRVIVVSGYGDQAVARKSIKEKGAESFVGKQEDPEVLQEELENVIAKFSAEKRGLHISPESALEQVTGTLRFPAEFSEQAADIFALLFPKAQKLHLRQLGHEDASTFGTVPRPRSVVFEARADELQPVLVKIARRHKIKIERDNYAAYIDNRLPGHKYPRIEKVDYLWDLGGATYTMLGGSGFQPFFKYYETAAISDINFTIAQFFEKTWGPLYTDARDPETTSLFQLYNKVWGREWFDRICAFQMPSFPHTITPPDPVDWIKKFVDPENDLSQSAGTKVAITHGDLHGDNLLIDDGRYAWFIDFERSGEGPILQDFVELESDLINRLPCSDDNFPVFLDLCLRVTHNQSLDSFDGLKNTPDAQIQKILQTISTLRQLACKCANTTDARPYLIGLLFNTLFRATIVKDPAQRRALMLASILCHRIDHWDEPWPPENWQTMP